MLTYNIFSNLANNNSLCLDVQNNNLVLNNFDSVNPSLTQQWAPAQLVSGQTLGGSALVNVGTGLYLCADGNQSGDYVSVGPYDSNWPNNNLIGWGIAGDGIIQLAQNTSLNLNVPGNITTPGTQIIIYNYLKGKNKYGQIFTWQFVNS